MSDAIHPLSRKSKQLQRQVTRNKRVSNVKQKRYNACVKPEVEKMEWFKENCKDLQSVSEDEAIELTRKFIARNKDELEQINEKNANKNQNKSFWKSKVMSDAFVNERRSFENGTFEIPEITSKKVLTKLKQWDGNTKSLLLIKMRRVRDDGNEDIELPPELEHQIFQNNNNNAANQIEIKPMSNNNEDDQKTEIVKMDEEKK